MINENVAINENVVVNENGVIISYDDKVFMNLTSEWNKLTEKHEVFKSYIKKSQVRKECLATITSTHSINYFHWMFECLPRLKLFGNVIDEIDYLVVPYNLKRFHLETLNLLGFPENKLLRIKNGDHLLCKNLYVPFLPSVSKWGCDFLRENFLPKDVAKPYRLIYISRSDALYRKIVNEKEVKNYLQDFGFEIIKMSELTFIEQVKICAEAKIVVGPHGAGLSNTVFCLNAKILEIFSPYYVNGLYWLISNQVGNEYYYLLGEDESGNSSPTWKNFKVDIKSFKQTIEWMMNDF